MKFSQKEIYQQIKEEYSGRLTSNVLKTDPNKIPYDTWIDDMKQWPEVDDGKLFSYILRTKAVEYQKIQRPGSLLIMDEWLCDTVLFTNFSVDSKHVFLKGCVSPLQKVLDDPRKVWVCLEGTKMTVNL